jgi:hypothetical protein
MDYIAPGYIVYPLERNQRSVFGSFLNLDARKIHIKNTIIENRLWRDEHIIKGEYI